MIRYDCHSNMGMSQDMRKTNISLLFYFPSLFIYLLTSLTLYPQQVNIYIYVYICDEYFALPKKTNCNNGIA